MSWWTCALLVVFACVAGWAVGSRQWHQGVLVRDRALASNKDFCRDLRTLIGRYTR